MTHPITALILKRPWTGLLAAIAGVSIGGSFHPPAIAQTIAQVHEGCFVESNNGQIFDLSVLCGEIEPVGNLRPRPTLGTGDVQVTIEWDTPDDLDLAVVDPAGEAIGYFNPTGASGGALDVDANAVCADIMSQPVENIFWPTGGAPSGEYTVVVSLFTLCDGPNQSAAFDSTRSVDFSLRVLVRGEVREFTGAVSPNNPEVSYTFNSP